MLQLVKNFLREEEGMGVIEIVIIIAVLVALALAFRGHIVRFFNKIIGQAFPDSEKINEIGVDPNTIDTTLIEQAQ
jgi:Flp pilus assembly pilin Flp